MDVLQRRRPGRRRDPSAATPANSRFARNAYSLFPPPGGGSKNRHISTRLQSRTIHVVDAGAGEVCAIAPAADAEMSKSVAAVRMAAAGRIKAGTGDSR